MASSIFSADSTKQFINTSRARRGLSGAPGAHYVYVQPLERLLRDVGAISPATDPVRLASEIQDFAVFFIQSRMLSPCPADTGFLVLRPRSACTVLFG